MSEYDDIKELYFGLKALSESTFPKKCASCGAIFKNSEEFFAKTIKINKSSGLKQTEDYDGQKIVEVFRNCHCGSTLMDDFCNRRDESEAGIIRREKFEKILVILINKGFSRETARLEILKFMHGKHSSLINGMLVKKETAQK